MLGGAIDAEARRRGQTLYSPDRRTPLHPPVLSEGAASLLADQLRAGRPVDHRPRRRRRTGPRGPAPGAGAQPRAAGLPGGAGAGRRRNPAGAARAAARGRRAAAAAGDRTRRHRARHARAGGGRRPGRRLDPGPARRPARSRAGTPRSPCSPAAARRRLMLDGASASSARCPPARPEDVDRLRLLAPALGRRLAGRRRARARSSPPWTPAAPGTRRSWRRRSPCSAARRTRRSTVPRPSSRCTAGSPRPYAHVTAPLRRLVDRFGTEVCLALAAGQEPAAPGCARRCPSCRP